MNILGVRIDNLPKKEILEKIELFLTENKFHQISTVNPEFILAASKGEKFKNILNQSDLNVADGVGVRFAFWRQGKNLKTRIAGIDLMYEILEIANSKKLSVFLAASKSGLSSWKETAATLSEKYPEIKFTGDSNDKASILFCNFGSPEQEFFINKAKNDNIRIAMGVGGSFDFITGKKKRAPELLRSLGLEWLWRFFLEPRYRAGRIFKAVFIFPIKVLFSGNKQ